ncbi:MAG: hypothetical protein WA771_05705, partial [Chthoniobacterales bacterium]
YRKRRINWSKVPFDHLELVGDAADAQWAEIEAEMGVFAERVRELGFTAVTLDDVAHLAEDGWYEDEVRIEIAGMRERFRRVFAVIRGAGLGIYVTSDYLTTTAAVDRRLGKSQSSAREWYAALVGRFLADFPEVDGVILRIGESDGLDVEGRLRSRLMLRSADAVNRLLRELLPVFEKAGRRLVLRTWTVGAHLIGDLIWNPLRLSRAVEGIDSRALVVSMKYGESDFFRYLSLNRQFFRIDLPKIIEFQARREYEGAGEYPSFIGWDCEHYAKELAGATGVIGMSVWCQTGGWHGWRRLAFLDADAVWIELNVAAAIGVVKDRLSVEESVERYVGGERAAATLELLRRSDEVVRELLYIEEFARQRLYFRRVRIPPLLQVYWDTIFINDATRKVLSHFVHDPERAIRAGEAAFGNFERMEACAEVAGLPMEDIRFMRDTFHIVLLARRYYLLPFEPELGEAIEEAKRRYKKRWPRKVRQRYRVRTSFAPTHVKRRTIAWVSRLVIRNQPEYRTVYDRLFTLRVLSWVYRLFKVRHQKALP